MTKTYLHELSWIEKADIRVIEAAKPFIRSRGGKAMGTVGKLADQPPLLLLSAAVAAVGALRADRRMVSTGLRMIAGETLATLFKDIGKRNVKRSRPSALLQNGSYRMGAGGSDDEELQSFPSGHTAGAAALAIAVSRSYPEVSATAFSTAAVLAAAQVPRRAHFPSDIIAGAALGAAAGWLACRIVR